MSKAGTIQNFTATLKSVGASEKGTSELLFIDGASGKEYHATAGQRMCSSATIGVTYDVEAYVVFKGEPVFCVSKMTPNMQSLKEVDLFNFPEKDGEGTVEEVVSCSSSSEESGFEESAGSENVSDGDSFDSYIDEFSNAFELSVGKTCASCPTMACFDSYREQLGNICYPGTKVPCSDVCLCIREVATSLASMQGKKVDLSLIDYASLLHCVGLTKSVKKVELLNPSAVTINTIRALMPYFDLLHSDLRYTDALAACITAMVDVRDVNVQGKEAEILVKTIRLIQDILIERG